MVTANRGSMVVGLGGKQIGPSPASTLTLTGPAGIEPATPGFGDDDIGGTPVGTRVHHGTVTITSLRSAFSVYPRLPYVLDTSWTQVRGLLRESPFCLPLHHICPID